MCRKTITSIDNPYEKIRCEFEVRKAAGTNVVEVEREHQCYKRRSIYNVFCLRNSQSNFFNIKKNGQLSCDLLEEWPEAADSDLEEWIKRLDPPCSSRWLLTKSGKDMTSRKPKLLDLKKEFLLVAKSKNDDRAIILTNEE